MRAVVRTRSTMSPAATHRPPHRSDAAVHQGPSAAQQHPAAHRGPTRQTSPVCLSRDA